MGPFSLDDPKDYSVDVHISDGGRPIQTSLTKLAIKVCSVAAWWETTRFRATSSEAVTTHVRHFWGSKLKVKSSLFLLVVVSVWCQADSHAVQSRRSEDGSERPCPRRHPALHLDHTRWDCFFLFLFCFSVIFSSRLRPSPVVLKKGKTSTEHHWPLFAWPQKSSSCESTSVLKLLSSEKENVFSFNLLLFQPMCVEGDKRFEASISVETKWQKRVK